MIILCCSSFRFTDACHFWFYCVRFSFFNTGLSDWLGRMSLKCHIFMSIGTLNLNSVSQIPSHQHCARLSATIFFCYHCYCIMQAVRTFFWTNRATCREWLTRVRLQLMLIAQRQHDWATVVRHGYLLLAELAESTSAPVLVVMMIIWILSTTTTITTSATTTFNVP